MEITPEGLKEVAKYQNESMEFMFEQLQKHFEKCDCPKLGDRVVHNDDCPKFSDMSGATEGVER
jgi:hypothetical protein